MTDQVKILIEKPPVWDNVCAAFKIIPNSAVFTYGDIIYNPQGFKLPDHIIEHEKVHMEQQNYSKEGAELWWGRFLREPLFRVDQEAKAYGRQYQYICEQGGSRPVRRHFIKQLAKILSGPLYNNAISFEKAVDLIKLYAHGPQGQTDS